MTAETKPFRINAPVRPLTKGNVIPPKLGPTKQ